MKNFKEFWPFYVSQHQHPLNRKIHFWGTLSAIIIAIVACVVNLKLLWLVPVASYGVLFQGHFFVEKSRPATFKYPFWSVLGDLYMFSLMLRGKMDKEIARLKAEGKL